MSNDILKVDYYITNSLYGYELEIPRLVNSFLQSNTKVLNILNLVLTDDTKECCKQVFNFHNPFDNSCAEVYKDLTDTTNILMFLNVNQTVSMEEIKLLNIPTTEYTLYECLQSVIAHECGHAISIYEFSRKHPLSSGNYPFNEMLLQVLLEEYRAEVFKWKTICNEYMINCMEHQFAHLDNVINYFKLAVIMNKLAYKSAILGEYNVIDDIMEEYRLKDYDDYVYLTVSNLLMSLL